MAYVKIVLPRDNVRSYEQKASLFRVLRPFRGQHSLNTDICKAYEATPFGFRPRHEKSYLIERRYWIAEVGKLTSTLRPLSLAFWSNDLGKYEGMGLDNDFDTCKSVEFCSGENIVAIHCSEGTAYRWIGDAYSQVCYYKHDNEKVGLRDLAWVSSSADHLTRNTLKLEDLELYNVMMFHYKQLKRATMTDYLRLQEDLEVYSTYAQSLGFEAITSLTQTEHLSQMYSVSRHIC